MVNEKSTRPKCGLVLIESQTVAMLESGQEIPGGTYHSRLEKEAERIMNNFSGDFDFIYPGLMSSKEQAVQALSLFANKKVDFIIVSFMSWAEDFAWVRFLRDIPAIPMIFYLPASEEIKFKNTESINDFTQFIASGGLVGALEGSGSIKRMSKKARIIIGENKESLDRIKAFGLAAKASAVLKNSKLGLLQSLNELMWSNYIDPYCFFDQVGPELKFISFSILKERIDKVSDKETGDYIKQLKKQYKISGNINEQFLFESVKASIGIAYLSEEMELDGTIVNDCDFGMYSTIGLRPGNFYHDSFNKNLSIMIPEGDVGTAALMLAIKIMTKKTVNFVEPFYLDVKNNAFAAGHAGPTDHTDPRYKDNVLIAMDSLSEKLPAKFAGAPFAWYRYPAGPKTMAHLSECKGNYKIVNSVAESLPGEHTIYGYSHSIFSAKTPVRELFEKIVNIGVTQHFAIVDGDIRRELTELAFINDFDYYSL